MWEMGVRCAPISHARRCSDTVGLNCTEEGVKKVTGMDTVIIVISIIVAGWLVMPPRAARRGWLALALSVLWAGITAVGWRRGVLAGYEAWLALLALMAALAALLV